MIQPTSLICWIISLPKSLIFGHSIALLNLSTFLNYFIVRFMWKCQQSPPFIWIFITRQCRWSTQLNFLCFIARTRNQLNTWVHQTVSSDITCRGIIWFRQHHLERTPVLSEPTNMLDHLLIQKLKLWGWCSIIQYPSTFLNSTDVEFMWKSQQPPTLFIPCLQPTIHISFFKDIPTDH